jgi:hypothetical protein
MKLNGKIEIDRVRRVNLDKDYPTLQAWYEGYDWVAPLKSEFGKTCFMIDGLAAIGILETDSSLTFLEPLIGNPAADKQARGQAVDKLIQWAKDYCRLMGKEHVYVTTNIPAVIERKEQFEFEEVRKTIIFRSKL